MLNIFDHYLQESQDLHRSLKIAGFHHPTVVLQPDGFLPKDVINPFLYYLDLKNEGKPLHFNQVKVPDYWEISGNNSSGEIHEYSHKRADIIYAEPRHFRWVERVNWLDKQGTLRIQDHYDQYGQRYAQSNFSLEGEATITTYFNQDGTERLIENHMTGDIIFHDQQLIKIFKSRLDFFLYFIKDAGFDLDHIFFNSLATPFFISNQLALPGKDVLFWQEPLHDQIPGNMMAILTNPGRCQKVIIPDKATYERAKALLPSQYHEQLSNIGYIYQFGKDNYLRPEALILTNSDQVEQVETFISNLPEVTFRIAAITEMSPKLLGLMKYDNAIMYQNVTTERVQALLHQADIYLDINYANEILSAVREAFLHNHLLLAYQETVHDRRYIPDAHIFQLSDTPAMIDLIRASLSDVEVMRTHLQMQGRHANDTRIEDYQAALNAVLS